MNNTSDKINNKEKVINPKYNEYADHQGNLHNPKSPFIKEINIQEQEKEDKSKININLNLDVTENKL